MLHLCPKTELTMGISKVVKWTLKYGAIVLFVFELWPLFTKGMKRAEQAKKRTHPKG
ncbi:hypothetical protein [Spirosoma migulaei]